MCVFFFFKQKTAYEMRISDWSSDVCSSDLKFDWPVLRDNVLAEVDRLEGLYGQTLDNHKVTVLKTRATVVGPQKVRLADGTAVTAERLLIATGGWPNVPAFPDSEHSYHSNEALHPTTPPKRNVTPGGGK